MNKNGKTEAIIFDFDGTLVNSVDIYLRLFMELGKRFGRDIDEEDFMQLNGMSVKDAIRELVRQKKFKRRIIPYLMFNKKSLQKGVTRETQLYPEVIECLTHLKKHYKLAIATNNKREHLETLCNRYDINDFFQAKIAQEDLSHRKPNPQAFLMAAEALEVAQQNCLVIEDAPMGLAAGLNAEMKTCVVEHTTDRKYFKRPPDVFIKDLSFLTREFIDTTF
jgi:HAD superfamily hydrolase (TIGR01509 family)